MFLIYITAKVHIYFSSHKLFDIYFQIILHIFIIKDIMRKEQKIINVVITPEMKQKLEESGYNKSKLVNSLLEKYFKKNS